MYIWYLIAFTIPCVGLLACWFRRLDSAHETKRIHLAGGTQRSRFRPKTNETPKGARLDKSGFGRR
jgi:hypothetical protein